MPVETIRGVNIVYEVIGDHGPWLALTTGGRRGHEEFQPLARKIAAGGFRVLLHDRRNTGASDIKIEGEEAEEEMRSDDLHALLARQDALPAFVGGSSSGARTSILFALRHPEAVRGLLLFRVTAVCSPPGGCRKTTMRSSSARRRAAAWRPYATPSNTASASLQIRPIAIA